MHARPRTLRLLLLAVLLLGALCCTASASASQRRVLARASAVEHAHVMAKAAERTVSKQRGAAARACAKHEKKLCRATRRRLLQSSARLARLRKALKVLTHGGGLPTGTGTTTSGSGKTPSHGTGSGSGTTSTPVTQPPAGESSFSSTPGSATFQPGINSGTTLTTDVNGAAMLGAKIVRIDFGIETTAAEMKNTIAGYAAKGIRVAPLAGFYGSLPTPTQAKNLVSWVRAYGPGGTFWAGRPDGALAIRSIEFGNETSYGYQYGDSAGAPSFASRAQTYALRLREAAEAISSTGVNVSLLAQADDWTGDWVNAMYAAVPNLDDYVGGWTIHPYGTNWKARLQDLIVQTAAHGAPSSIPIDITEWGVATDGGNCLDDNYGLNKCMSYQEAANAVTNTEQAMRAQLGGRLGMFMLYQVHDQSASGSSNDREAYFGALQAGLQSKGAYTTAVQSLMASS